MKACMAVALAVTFTELHSGSNAPDLYCGCSTHPDQCTGGYMGLHHITYLGSTILRGNRVCVCVAFYSKFSSEATPTKP